MLFKQTSTVQVPFRINDKNCFSGRVPIVVQEAPPDRCGRVGGRRRSRRQRHRRQVQPRTQLQHLEEVQLGGHRTLQHKVKCLSVVSFVIFFKPWADPGLFFVYFRPHFHSNVNYDVNFNNPN